MQTQLGVLVDEELARKIDEYRNERHLSRSDVVRLALLDLLNMRPTQPQPQPAQPEPVQP